MRSDFARYHKSVADEAKRMELRDRLIAEQSGPYRVIQSWREQIKKYADCPPDWEPPRRFYGDWAL